MKFVTKTVKDRVGIVTMNRPEKRNALNGEMVNVLLSIFKDLEADPEVKVVVLRADGKTFCAGADLEYLKNLRGYTQEQNFEDSKRFKDLLLKIYKFKKVVIAQVQGPAVAGGAGLVSVCDFAFGSTNMIIGYPEVRIGFVPAIVLPFLLRRLSESRVRSLLLSGRSIDSNQALEIGLLYKIVDEHHLEKEVFQFALELCSTNSSQSMTSTKKLITAIPDLPLEDALELACKSNARTRTTSDFIKGISEFLAKKDIKW